MCVRPSARSIFIALESIFEETWYWSTMPKIVDFSIAAIPIGWIWILRYAKHNSYVSKLMKNGSKQDFWTADTHNPSKHHATYLLFTLAQAAYTTRNHQYISVEGAVVQSVVQSEPLPEESFIIGQQRCYFAKLWFQIFSSSELCKFSTAVTPAPLGSYTMKTVMRGNHAER